MNVQKVIEELKRKYPGKNIVVNDPDNPTEIICEVEPASVNPEKSVAIAVLDGKVKHSHGMLTQVYEVLKGSLKITKGGKTHFLNSGQKIEIGPEEFHLAKGKETWVKVTSTPAWDPKEHTEVKSE